MITIFMTQPTYQNISGGIIGCCDAPLHIWTNWWAKYSLIDLHQSPFSTQYQFYPQKLGIMSLSDVLSYKSIILSIPLQLIFGLNTADNLVIILFFVFSGLASYLLIMYLTNHKISSFIGSLMFAFSPPIFSRLAYGHYSVVTIWPAPLIILFWIKSFSKNRIIYSLFAGLLLALQMSIGPYTGKYLILTLVILTFWDFWRKRKDPYKIIKILTINFIVILFTFLIAFLPHILGIVSNKEKGLTWQSAIESTDNLAPDLLAYITQTPLHFQLKEVFLPINKKIGAVDLARVVFPGYLALILGLFSIVYVFFYSKEKKLIFPWILNFLILFSFSLGPHLQINGSRTNLPLPSILLLPIPFFGGGRITGNAIFLISLSLGIISAFTLKRLFNYLKTPLKILPLSIILSLIVLYESLSIPIATSSVKISPFYYQLGNQPSTYSILDVPLGWRDGIMGIGDMRSEYLLYATIHQKPIIAGFAGRIPQSYFDFYSSKPELGYFINYSGKPTTQALSPTAVKKTLRQLNVRYVIVHPNPYRKEMKNYLINIIGLSKEYEDELLDAYRVN